MLFELLVIAFGPAASVRAFAWGRTKAGLTSFSCTTIREHLPLGGTSYKVHPKKQLDLIGVLDNEIFHYMKHRGTGAWAGPLGNNPPKQCHGISLTNCRTTNRLEKSSDAVGFKSENVNDGFSISKLGLNEHPFRDLKASLRQNPAP